MRCDAVLKCHAQVQLKPLKINLMIYDLFYGEATSQVFSGFITLFDLLLIFMPILEKTEPNSITIYMPPDTTL